METKEPLPLLTPEQMILKDLQVIRLIKNEILYFQFLHKLRQAGLILQDDRLEPDLYKSVFNYMGITDEFTIDEIAEWYFQYIERVCENPQAELKPDYIEKEAINLFYELKKQINTALLL